MHTNKQPVPKEILAWLYRFFYQLTSVIRDFDEKSTHNNYIPVSAEPVWIDLLNGFACLGVDDPGNCTCRENFGPSFPAIHDADEFPELIWLHNNHRRYNSIIHNYISFYDDGDGRLYSRLHLHCARDRIRADRDEDYRKNESILERNYSLGIEANFLRINPETRELAPNADWVDLDMSFWVPLKGETQEAFCDRVFAEDTRYLARPETPLYCDLDCMHPDCPDCADEYSGIKRETWDEMERRIDASVTPVDPSIGNGRVLFL